MNELRDSRLTPAGQAFVTQTLDPFHDSIVKPTGFPGGGTSNTITQRVRRQVTISKPASVADGELWDCSIFSLPVVFNADLSVTPGLQLIHDSAPTLGQPGVQNYVTYDGTTSSNAQWTTAPHPPQMSGVTILSAPSSVGIMVSDARAQVHCLNPTGFISGPCRVVSGGFEVTNTTSDLNAQGTLTAFRVPSCTTEDNFFTYVHDAASPLTSHVISGPPLTQADADLLPQSVTWLAKEGSYTVMSYAQAENDLEFPRGQPVATRLPYSDQGNTTLFNVCDSNIVFGIQSIPDDHETNGIVNMASGMLLTPFNTEGVYLTGLSSQSTLTVVGVWLVERAPTFTEPQLIVLAQPCSPVDPEAMRFIVDVVRELPPATKVGNNASGDYWRRVLSTIKKVLGSKSVKSGLDANAQALIASAAESAVERMLARSTRRAEARTQKQTQPQTAAPAGGKRTQKKFAKPAK